ncbi:hypothetical protein LVY75_34460 (plasmid) [Sinorhizobium sp. B11]
MALPPVHNRTDNTIWLDTATAASPPGCRQRLHAAERRSGCCCDRGSNYIDAVYGARFLGSVVGAAQERQWPRESEIVNGKVLQSNAVPGAVVNASYEAAHQKAVAAGSLSVVGSASSAVKREKVGQVEVEYQSVESDVTAAGITPLISIVDGMVAPYLRCEDLVYSGIMSTGGSRCG